MKKLLCIAMSLLCAVSFFGCTGIKQNQRFTSSVYDSFDTVTSVVAYDKDEKSFSSHLSSFKNELSRYDKLYSIYDDYDALVNLKYVNEHAALSPVKCPEEIISLLKFAKECYSLTNGAINICMGSVLRLWHDAREYSLNNPDKAYIPDMKQLKEAGKHSDIDNLIIDENNGTVFFKDKEMSLDVGAIAKGFTAERMKQYLKNGIWEDYAISIGGNVLTNGYKNSKEKSKWNIEIENPNRKSAEPLETLSVTDMTVVTSGDYQRYYTYGGKNYCHIIDPKTLMPAGNFTGVSIVMKGDFTLADALSTALFILPLDEGKKVLEKVDGAEAVWVDKNYKKTYSNGFKNYIKK